MDENTLKYQEKNIVRNLKKYLKEMIIIKRTENENVIIKSIEETINLCKVTSILNELILITKCYGCADIIVRNTINRESVDDFNKKINLLIRDKIKDLQMLI